MSDIGCIENLWAKYMLEKDNLISHNKTQTVCNNWVQLVYLVFGYTDMHQSIDGRAAIVEEVSSLTRLMMPSSYFAIEILTG